MRDGRLRVREQRGGALEAGCWLEFNETKGMLLAGSTTDVLNNLIFRESLTESIS